MPMSVCLIRLVSFFYPWAIVCEYCPPPLFWGVLFLFHSKSRVWCVFYIFYFSCLVSLREVVALFYGFYRMPLCFLSFVSGKECILVMWYRYAAVLCSLGWLDV